MRRITPRRITVETAQNTSSVDNTSISLGRRVICFVRETQKFEVWTIGRGYWGKFSLVKHLTDKESNLTKTKKLTSLERRMASSVYNQNRDAGVDFQKAVHLVTTEYNVNYEVMLSQFAPQEVFVQYGPEVRIKNIFRWKYL